jgi:ribonuclease HII
MPLPDFSFEQQFPQQIVVGLDEVGRGPLAGPLVMGAVYFPNKAQIPAGINDSKLLSKKKRTLLYEQLIKIANYGLGFVWPAEIDTLKLTKATELAIKRALTDIKLKVDVALIDGNLTYDLPFKYLSIIKGDSKSISIAAASIIAKVVRDNYMSDLALSHPEYLWEKNAGYPTKAHLEAIKVYGSNQQHHRKSFAGVFC